MVWIPKLKDAKDNSFQTIGIKLEPEHSQARKINARNHILEVPLIRYVITYQWEKSSHFKDHNKICTPLEMSFCVITVNHNIKAGVSLSGRRDAEDLQEREKYPILPAKVTHLFRSKKILATHSPEMLHLGFMDLLCGEEGQWWKLTASLENETRNILHLHVYEIFGRQNHWERGRVINFLSLKPFYGWDVKDYMDKPNVTQQVTWRTAWGLW